MNTAVEIAREIFPDASEADLEHAICGRTGFPSFWPLRDGESVECCFRRQLVDYRDALAAQRPEDTMCDFCLRPAVSGRWTCAVCDAAFSPDRETAA